MQDSDAIRRRNLPYWDLPGATYFVTTCLDGSIPAQGLLDLEAYRIELARRPRPKDQSDIDWAVTLRKLDFARVDAWLDRGLGTRHLQDIRLAKIVVESMFHFAGQRYDLLGYVIMPSHFHWVFRPSREWIATLKLGRRSPRESIIHSINRASAMACNQVLGSGGQFWQHESYDHWIRNASELERILKYIENNPVKAGFVAEPKLWQSSSAFLREHQGLELGMPLCGLKRNPQSEAAYLVADSL